MAEESERKRPRAEVSSSSQEPKWTEVTFYKETATSLLVPSKLPQEWVEAGNLFIRIQFFNFINLFICLFIYLCIYLFIYLFICLFIYLFTYLFVFIYLFID